MVSDSQALLEALRVLAHRLGVLGSGLQSQLGACLEDKYRGLDNVSLSFVTHTRKRN